MSTLVPVRKAAAAAGLLTLLVTILSLQGGASGVQAATSSSSSVSSYTFGLTADLAVTQDGPATVTRGAPVTYTFLVSNLGPGVAAGVTLTDDIPAGVIFQPSGSDSRCRQTASTKVMCDVGDILNNQPVLVKVAFTTPVFDACVDTPVVNIGAVQSNQADPAMNNNRSQAITTTVKCGPKLTECSDGRDNDGDGLVDMQDPGCQNPQQNDESKDETDAQIQRDRQREQLRLQMRMHGYISSSSSLPPPSFTPSPVPLPVPVTPRVRPVRIPVRTNPVSVTVHAAQQEANPGDTVIYTITVRNSSADAQNGVEVGATFPPASLTILDPSNGTVDNGQIIWNVDLRPNQTRTLSFSGELAKTLGHGDTVMLETKVSSADGTAFGTSSINIIKSLPQTGASPFTSPLENGSMFLRPFSASSTGTAAIAFTLMALVVTTGATLAFGFVRKDQE